jgi:hypothetical protein
MQYLLVALSEGDPEGGIIDAVNVAKEFESRDDVHRAILVRNSADRSITDQYVATYFTTTLALSRLNEPEPGRCGLSDRSIVECNPPSQDNVTCGICGRKMP